MSYTKIAAIFADSETLSGQTVTVRRGDRVAQLVFQSVRRPEPVAADSLSDTARGAGGFGHTGAL